MIKTFTQHDAILYVYSELNIQQKETLEKEACIQPELNREVRIFSEVSTRLDQVKIKPPKRMTDAIKLKAREALGRS